MDDVDTILQIVGNDNTEQPDLPPELVTNAVASMSDNIETTWQHLNAIVRRHEGTIQTRWKKKSQAKRRELLCLVQPDIPAMHRPDTEGSSKYCCATCECQLKDKRRPASNLWPYINLEDLSDAKSLLIFINARARNHPATFASSELEFSPHAVPGETKDQYAHINVCIGHQDPNVEGMKDRKYGRVVGFEHETQPEKQDPDWRQIKWVLAPGLHILRIQEGILRFLVGCCENIMHDIAPDSLCSDVFPILSEPPSLLGQEEMVSSFADASRKAPYRERNVTDFARIQHLVSTVLDKSKDHIWALREDPAYFAECVRAYADHLFENVLDANGQSLHWLGSRRFYSRVLWSILVDAYTDLIFWDRIHQETVELGVLFQSIFDGKSDKVIFKRYFDTMEVVYYRLRARKDHMRDRLNVFSLGAPQLRHLRVRVPIPGELNCFINQKKGDEIVEEGVRRLLLFLSRNDESIHELRYCLDLLETQCQRQPPAREMLSPLIEGTLYDLSIRIECLHQLRISYGCTLPQYRFDFLDKNPVYPGLISDFVKSLGSWGETLKGCCQGVVAPSLGDPTDGKFDYPSEDIHSRRTVETRRKAERNLDRFWKCVDKSFRKLTGDSQHETVRRLFEEGGPMRRTVPWHDPKELKATRTPPIVYAYQPVSEIFHNSKKEITGNFDRLAIAEKTKRKTHCGMTTVAEDVNQETHQQPTVVSKPSYCVGRDTYVVIKALFYVPNELEPPGKVRWDQIVTSLTKLGFSAEKLHGSIWQFSPKKLNLPRGIHFHEPHPGGEVPLTLARRYGRRLNRAYGWEASMFKQK